VRVVRVNGDGSGAWPLLSAIARDADASFVIKDATVRQFRSLSATMCVAQTLVVGYAYRVEGRARRRG